MHNLEEHAYVSSSQSSSTFIFKLTDFTRGGMSVRFNGALKTIVYKTLIEYNKSLIKKPVIA